MLAVKQTASGVSFEVRVTPRAMRSALSGVADGVLKIQLTAPPVDGAANAMLVELLAELFEVPRRAVEVTHGDLGRLKTVRVSGLDAPALLARVQSALD